MQGTIVSVNTSTSKGIKKTPIALGHLIERQGLAEDAHNGPWHRQISLLAQESIQKILDKGLDVKAGDFAENLTTQGLVLYTLPIGTLLQIGDQAVLKITQIGKQCHTRCAIYTQAGDCVMPREGIFAEVIKSGTVKSGDRILIIDA